MWGSKGDAFAFNRGIDLFDRVISDFCVREKKESGMFSPDCESEERDMKFNRG